MMPHPAPTPRHVFVYGTLRASGSNDITRHVPPPVALGCGAIAGTLYDLGAYPGAVLGGSGRIVGEVYRITPEVERALDVLEGIEDDGSGEYSKREVRVDVGGEHWTCLVYEIAIARTIGAGVIVSGDWLKRGGSISRPG